MKPCYFCKRSTATYAKMLKGGVQYVCKESADVEICNRMAEEAEKTRKQFAFVESQEELRKQGARLMTCSCGKSFYTIYPIETFPACEDCPFCGITHWEEPKPEPDDDPYTCRHCRANLDEGDIWEYFIEYTGNEAIALESATFYGWSETNPLHFNRAYMETPQVGTQYYRCPDCGKKDPFANPSCSVYLLGYSKTGKKPKINTLVKSPEPEKNMDTTSPSESPNILSSATYTCRHCRANLDEGDVLEHYLTEYPGNRDRAMTSAKLHGWTETNRVHFNRAYIEQPPVGPQYIRCPDCGIKDPFAPGEEQRPTLT